MATRIRLRRVGRKKQSTFRIVVAGQVHPRDGRSSETIGKYNPRTHPTFIEIDEERALFWLRQGAQASSKVESLFRQAGIMKKFAEGGEGEGVIAIGDEKGKTIIGIQPARPGKKAEAKAEAAEPETKEAGPEVEEPEAEVKEDEAAASAEEAEDEVQEPEAKAGAEEATEAEGAEEGEEEAEAESPDAKAEEVEAEEEAGAEEEDEEKE